MFRVYVASALVAISSVAHADEGIPFPELDTKSYCTELVAKMLDANEKKIEFEKCLSAETTLREATRPYWGFVSPKAQKYVGRYLNEKKHQTYVTVLQYVSYAVGEACITKKLICRAP